MKNSACVILLKSALLIRTVRFFARPEPDDSQRQRDEARLMEELKAKPLRQQSKYLCICFLFHNSFMVLYQAEYRSFSLL